MCCKPLLRSILCHSGPDPSDHCHLLVLAQGMVGGSHWLGSEHLRWFLSELGWGAAKAEQSSIFGTCVVRGSILESHHICPPCTSSAVQQADLVSGICH